MTNSNSSNVNRVSELVGVTECISDSERYYEAFFLTSRGLDGQI